MTKRKEQLRCLKTMPWFEYDLHTQDPHVVFALLFILLDQVVEVVSEVLEQIVLLVDLQAQDAV